MGAYEFCWNRSHFFGNLAQLGPVCCGFLGIPPAPFCPKVSQGSPSPKSALIVFLRENPQSTGSSGLWTGILGPTGKNFAAGMSGGIAYVLDEHHDLYMRLNKDQVMTDTLTEPHDIAELRSLIEAHVAATGSPRGKKILAAFHSYIPCFKKVMPRDYDRMLRSIAQYEEKGMTREQAEIEAFYANTRA